MSLLFNTLSRLVITFLPRSKRLSISWLQSPSAVIWEPPKIKSDTVSTLSLFPMKWWAQMPWSSFSECWALSQLNSYQKLTEESSSLVHCITSRVQYLICWQELLVYIQICSCQCLDGSIWYHYELGTVRGHLTIKHLEPARNMISFAVLSLLEGKRI